MERTDMDDRSPSDDRLPRHRHGERLIGLPIQEGSETVVRYITSEDEVDALIPLDERIRRALGSIGAWSDIDFDDMLEDLDRIRHGSRPTPPIESSP
jgi:hypothetical protein